MEKLKTLLKNEEKEYKQSITEQIKPLLEIDCHFFTFAIKDSVQCIKEAYEDYAMYLIMHKDIKKDTFERRIKRNELYINHWQKMIEIVVEELVKRVK